MNEIYHLCRRVMVPTIVLENKLSTAPSITVRSAPLYASNEGMYVRFNSHTGRDGKKRLLHERNPLFLKGGHRDDYLP